MPTKSPRKPAPRAPRERWEAALSKIEALPAKSPAEGPAQFLPRFVAALREKGYLQDEIVQKILALRLGVTKREIRAADTDVRRGASASVFRAATSPGSATPARPPAARASRPTGHAGLAGDGELQRR